MKESNSKTENESVDRIKEVKASIINIESINKQHFEYKATIEDFICEINIGIACIIRWGEESENKIS